MKLSPILNPKLVKCRLSARGKESALEEMLQVMEAGTPGVTLAELRAALAEREKLGPFSMAKGCAFPHARTEKVQDFHVAVGTCPEGVDFRAPDGQLIRIVVLFVIPKKHSNLYLHTLAQFLNLFSVEENLQKVVAAGTGTELVAAVDALQSKPATQVLGVPLPSVTAKTTLAKAMELVAAGRESLPVVDAEGCLTGEVTAASLLELGVREHLLRLANPASLQSDPGTLEQVLRSHGDAPLDALGVIHANGFKTVQEEEPLLDMAVKLCHAGVRGAYVVRGRRLRFYNQGAEHFKRKELDQAVECFRRSAEADKEFYRAWAYLGMAYAQQGQLDPAIDAYRKCIDIAPQYHKAFNNVGELYRRKGLLDYAAMVFKMATEIEPTISHYFYNLGITYFEIGMYAQAEEAFAQAVRLDPNDYEYSTELAQVRFTQKNYEGALQALQRFHEAHPDHPRAGETGARVAMLRRRLDQLKSAAPSSDPSKSEIRRAAIEEGEDENAKTKIADLPPGLGEKPPTT
jgi:mannitol/fructose-specific phosphotransferase system IIA component (Ntr-type)/tetratricopeptide (TPR) repeat protein